MNSITVATYNMHKGMSALNQRVQLSQMADALRQLSADVLFLLEVQGENLRRAQKLADFPHAPHHEVLGEALTYHHRSYGKNAEFAQRHHGNAILSHLPIATKNNVNISVNKLEQRGVLHCEIQPDTWDLPLVCLCAHLNLREPDRIKQYQAIYDYVNEHIHPDSPLILAGDFNDWRHRSCENLGENLGLNEVFASQGSRPKTFPARLPVLSLDRIYTRHLDIVTTRSHRGAPWQHLSDHLPLSATLTPQRNIIKELRPASARHI